MNDKTLMFAVLITLSLLTVFLPNAYSATQQVNDGYFCYFDKIS